MKVRLKEPKHNPMYGTHRYGKDNPNYKTGEFCIDNIILCKLCGKEISKTTKHKLCKSCVNKNNKHTYKDGRTLKKYYCIDCGKQLSNTAYLGYKRCSICSMLNLPKIIKKIKYHGIWMRSSWEVAYAEYLDRQKIKWQYESKTFDLGDTTYTPDFYLPETDEYIEIKGFFRKDAKRKFKLFKKKYYHIKIFLLTGKELKKLNIIK